jgi:hypothetical protein
MPILLMAGGVHGSCGFWIVQENVLEWLAIPLWFLCYWSRSLESSQGIDKCSWNLVGPVRELTCRNGMIAESWGMHKHA